MPPRLQGRRAIGAITTATLVAGLLSYTALTQMPSTSTTKLEGDAGQRQTRMNVEMPAPYAPGQFPPSTARIADIDLEGPRAGETRDRFASFKEGGVERVADNPVSTFSVDVDTASYAYVRQTLQDGVMPPADAVRVEELINYFDYDYDAPPSDGPPFAAGVSVIPSPWNPNNRLVHIGIQGQRVDIASVAPANLVLLIDTSGSMNAPDKLPLLKRALALLVQEMRPQDTISIVTYAGSAGIALAPTPIARRAEILAVLERLEPGGSTAGAQGIQAAYALAEQAFIDGGNNRVLLATDGDFNVGIAEPDDLERLIEQKRRSGIFLSILGFGRGNYNDAAMQALAQAGNGTAAYIDNFLEARKVLVDELGGTLMTIAKDVKLQVEFNPRTVSEYRLIGYETRLLQREDFNNDAVDAGDIGAGHSVTALYEITPVGAPGSMDLPRYTPAVAPATTDHADELGYLKIRYKAPTSDTSALIETPIAMAPLTTFEAAPEATRFAVAVAAFGQKLRASQHLGAMDWASIQSLARSGIGEDPTGRRAELLRLIDVASGLYR